MYQNRTQRSYDPDIYGSKEVAKQERDKEYKRLKATGCNPTRWVLKGQERGYSGFGTSRDLSRRDIYMLDING
tara:strand:+ start:441 stop:659 length:219 start_codon:yes stop_codon:yes gene_type:complete